MSFACVSSRGLLPRVYRAVLPVAHAFAKLTEDPMGQVDLGVSVDEVWTSQAKC